MYTNLYYNSDFVFSTTSSGVGVYTKELSPLGNILIDYVSCIYSNNDYLYIATTNSGVWYSPISSLSAGVFNDINVYKQYPDITSNVTKYIHGAGDYLLVTTESGVDQFNTSTFARIYNESSKEVSKCFQTTSGRFYYVTNEITDVFFDKGTHKSVITLTRQTSLPDYQVEIILDPSNFDYSKTTSDGRDLLFYSPTQEELSFYIESWVVGGSSTIWVKVPIVGTAFLYIIYGDAAAITKSDPIAVFDFYDNFDYPVEIIGSNIFLPAYGTITVSGSIHPEYLYDGNTTTYYISGYPVVGDYFQIEFFVPRTIRYLQIWQSSYSFGVDVYIYASNTGAFTGEQALLYTRTSSLTNGIVLFFYNTEAYTYYRVVRGAGTTAWQLTEINMKEASYIDITTVSGSPWVYSTDPDKFIIDTESILTCNFSNSDYIRTDYVLGMPTVIEQRVKLNYGTEGIGAYSTILEPQRDGVVCYPAGTPTFTPIFSNAVSEGFYAPTHAISTSWQILSIYIIAETIKLYIEGTTSFYTSWGGNTSMAGNRALSLFSTGPNTSVSIDWVRTRKYDLYEPEVYEISSSKKLEQTYELQVMYGSTSNWTDSTVEYTYSMLDGVLINDIFITENTSTYTVDDNVIFIATSDGLIIFEERRGDESNSRVKYFKARSN